MYLAGSDDDVRRVHPDAPVEDTDVEEVVGFCIDCGMEPAALAIEVDHALVVPT